MKKHVGIVLKQYRPDDSYLVVFDRHEGKLFCRVKYKHPIVAGAIISYFICKSGSYFSFSSMEIVDVPLCLAREQIVFLHHLLELCFYFLPQGGSSIFVFDQIILFYKDEVLLVTPLHKKIFLFKLFVSFGFYVEHAPLSVQLFYRLSSESIDSIVSSSLHLEIERLIDQWLCSCIGAHPKIKDFKTVRFLKQLGCYEKI